MDSNQPEGKGKFFGMILLLIVLFVVTWNMGGKEFWVESFGPIILRGGEEVGVIEIIEPSAKGTTPKRLPPGHYSIPDGGIASTEPIEVEWYRVALFKVDIDGAEGCIISEKMPKDPTGFMGFSEIKWEANAPKVEILDTLAKENGANYVYIAKTWKKMKIEGWGIGISSSSTFEIPKDTQSQIDKKINEKKGE